MENERKEKISTIFPHLHLFSMINNFFQEGKFSLCNHCPTFPLQIIIIFSHSFRDNIFSLLFLLSEHMIQEVGTTLWDKNSSFSSPSISFANTLLDVKIVLPFVDCFSHFNCNNKLENSEKFDQQL